jgi:hypothetical protein
MALTVTTEAKYLKATDGFTTKRIIYANIFDITNTTKEVMFNTNDPRFSQSAGYILPISDIATFDGSGSFTADSIAAAVLAKVIA